MKNEGQSFNSLLKKMLDKIRFTIANHTQPSGEQVLVPRLKSGNIEEFIEKYNADQKPFSQGSMIGALYTMRDELVDMMSNGSAIHLPGLGTFTLTLGGGVEVQDGKYVGRDVHVDGIRFTPDEELLAELRRLKVDQEPLPMRPVVTQEQIDSAMADLFARKDVITRADLYRAFDGTVSRHRLSDLLARLVDEGRLVREGSGSQTRYRKVFS